MYPYFAQKTMDIQSKSKDVMYPTKKHNEYSTSAQSNIILSHNWIETNTHYIKVWIVWAKHENIKLINGVASSSTLVEELALHDEKNHK